MGMSEAFVDSIKDYDVYANIGTYPEDIIILHGTNDFIVDIKYSEQAVEKYPRSCIRSRAQATDSTTPISTGWPHSSAEKRTTS